MTDILRRSLAPVTDEAWKEIDSQATRTLKGNLSARGLVDLSGPHGWTMAAVNLGSVRVGNGVAQGQRKCGDALRRGLGGGDGWRDEQSVGHRQSRRRDADQRVGGRVRIFWLETQAQRLGVRHVQSGADVLRQGRRVGCDADPPDGRNDDQDAVKKLEIRS